MRSELGGQIGCELFFVLPEDLAGARLQQVGCLLMDIVAHCQAADISIVPGLTLGPMVGTPETWPSKCILIDEPVYEAESFDLVSVGLEARHEIPLYAVFPLHESEQRYITLNGLEAFEEIADQSAESIVDPLRPPFV